MSIQTQESESKLDSGRALPGQRLFTCLPTFKASNTAIPLLHSYYCTLQILVTHSKISTSASAAVHTNRTGMIYFILLQIHIYVHCLQFIRSVSSKCQKMLFSQWNSSKRYLVTSKNLRLTKMVDKNNNVTTQLFYFLA